jgi:nitrous oxidase accessory protein
MGHENSPAVWMFMLPGIIFSNTFDVATNGVLVLNSFNRNYWDKYEGYDLNKDHVGDIAFHPVSLFSMVVEKNPSAMMLFRSFITTLLDKT